jgi:hypothetical protein
MSGVIIEDKSFKLVETGVAIVPELLIPADKMPKFEEFHACELYGGYGIFEGIDQELRFDAMRRLLALIEFGNLSVVYGGVNIEKLRNEIYGSAEPLDVSFRICIDGINAFGEGNIHARVNKVLGDKAENYTMEKLTPEVVSGLMEELVILIMDECPDKKIKEMLQRSYHSRRPSLNTSKNSFSYLHDDMYFGDSRHSIGIQLADMCSYFIARHLEGDEEIESFYKMIEPNIVYSQTQPLLPTAIPAEAQ